MQFWKCYLQYVKLFCMLYSAVLDVSSTFVGFIKQSRRKVKKKFRKIKPVVFKSGRSEILNIIIHM